MGKPEVKMFSQSIKRNEDKEPKLNWKQHILAQWTMPEDENPFKGEEKMDYKPHAPDFKQSDHNSLNIKGEEKLDYEPHAPDFGLSDHNFSPIPKKYCFALQSLPRK